MRWEDLFGTIDVSTQGLSSSTAVPPTAAPVVNAVPPVASPAPQAVPVQVPAAQTAPANQATESYPGVWEMAQTFTSSAVQFAASGGQTVSRDVREQRLAMCQMCPEYDGTRCVRCGCFIAAKTWMPHEKCPIGKWPV
ncbi:hypothetical protein NA78x_005685 [Anatilimnocola sp. NA78]|uniref:hypothetical protein n=1 Tax=Anatilimnocola sp. NA78 TaxID=3415683 RepID=UPI003CE4E6EE